MSKVYKNKKESLGYPPGGILIWIIVFVEFATFCMGICSLVYDKTKDLSEFQTMQTQLNRNFAFWNTIFLLTSGALLALSVTLKENQEDVGFAYGLIASMGFGLGFLVLKFLEFYDKWTLGFSLDSNLFYTYYWLLTGFHYLHVAVGMIILFYIYIHRKSMEFVNIEAGAIFWHMCDLIWLILYPALYLIQ